MHVDIETLPPQDMRAERAVLGACIVSVTALQQCLEVLETQHFYRLAHQYIWRCIRALHMRGEAVDSVTVTNELRAATFEEAAGSIDYVAECIDETPTAANAGHYAAIVREKWLRREVIEIGRRLQAGGFDESASVDDALNETIQRVIQLQVRDVEHGQIEHVRKPMEALRDKIQSGPLREQTRVETGIAPLDQKIGGYQSSDLHYWGGAPGSGKTTLSMQSAYRVANSKRGMPLVVYFSMELGSTQFARRLASFESRVVGKTIEFGPISDFLMDRPRVNAAIERVAGLPMYVCFGRLSTSQILTRLRHLMGLEKRKPSVVFIDRLELLSDPDIEAMEETKKVPILSPRVKGIATSLDVPVVCLAQLNRAGRTNEPSAEAFRASGAIEQDCQVAVIVKTDKLSETSVFHVVKQNDGPTGQCDPMRFEAKLPMFLEMKS